MAENGDRAVLEKIRTFLWGRGGRIVLGVLAGLFVLLFMGEVWLNLRVRSAIRAKLNEEKRPEARIEIGLGWLGLGNLWWGRVGPLKVRGENCSSGGLKVRRLSAESRGFEFDRGALWRERRLVFVKLERTRISGEVTEGAVTDYLLVKYPHLGLTAGIFPGSFRLGAGVMLLGQRWPAVVEGRLKVTGPKLVRFYPTRLRVAGQAAPAEWLVTVGKEIPLEFPVLGEWPLKLKRVELGMGKVRIWLEEGERG